MFAQQPGLRFTTMIFVLNISLCLHADTMPEIIEQVRVNEALYSNIEASVTTQYERSKDRATFARENGKVIDSYTAKVHFVRQDGMFRLVRNNLKQYVTDGKSADSVENKADKREREYDGEATRALQDGTRGNIYNDVKHDSYEVRPHMLIMRDMTKTYHTDLSSLLEGDAAMGSTGSYSGNKNISSEYVGEETVDGEPCVVVTVTFAGETTKGFRTFYLSKNKNFLPVLAKSFNPKVSETTPTSVARTVKWNEIAEGLWFPGKIEIDAYDKKGIFESGKQMSIWKMTVDTETVSLDPDFDKSYFQQIKFADGVHVAEIDLKSGEQELVKSFIKGSPNDVSSGPPTKTTPYWSRPIFLVNAAIILFILAYVALRNRKTKATT